MLLALVLACSTGPETPTDGPDADAQALQQTPQFARLTHLQWANSVQDLLRLDTPPAMAADFIGDPLSEGGFENDADNLQVTPELFADYARAAEQLAADLVVYDPAAVARYALVAPEDPRADVSPGVLDVYDAQSGVASTGGAQGTSGWNLWANGTLDFDITVPAGPHRFVATVWGQQAGTDAVQAELRVDGVSQGVFDVPSISASSADVLEVDVDLTAGAHTFTVAFLNDFYENGEDRNLVVESIGLQTLITAPEGTDADRDRWIRRFGELVHRRPLTEAQVSTYAQLFEQGADMPFTGDRFRDGVYTVVMAMLQSPYFLYRTEIATSPVASSAGPADALDDYEVASKLAYALWNRPPDVTLRNAAADGQLTNPAGLRQQAERMLDDGNATPMLDDFHRQLLDLDGFANIYKDPDAFPEWSPDLNDALAEQVRRYSRSAVQDDWSIFELYTSTETWVDASTAPLLGLDATGWEVQQMDSTQRAGLLTLPGFMAKNAHAREIDSIHRGVFVNLALLCSDLPPPPMMVPPLPPPEPGLSNRERVTRHTGPGTCGGDCHGALINPVGFAFENFDALGRWQEDDEGPIDASGSFAFEDGERTWSDAVGFAAAVGSAPDAHRCMIRNWMRYTHGHEPAGAEERLIDTLTQRSLTEDRAIKALILDLVTSESFRLRAQGVE